VSRGTEIDKLREEAKERQRASGRFAGKDKDGNPIVKDFQEVADLPRSETKTKTRQKLAEKAGVGERSMGYLMAVPSSDKYTGRAGRLLTR